MRLHENARPRREASAFLSVAASKAASVHSIDPKTALQLAMSALKQVSHGQTSASTCVGLGHQEATQAILTCLCCAWRGYVIGEEESLQTRAGLKAQLVGRLMREFAQNSATTGAAASLNLENGCFDELMTSIKSTLLAFKDDGQVSSVGRSLSSRDPRAAHLRPDGSVSMRKDGVQLEFMSLHQ